MLPVCWCMRRDGRMGTLSSEPLGCRSWAVVLRLNQSPAVPWCSLQSWKAAACPGRDVQPSAFCLEVMASLSSFGLLPLLLAEEPKGKLGWPGSLLTSLLRSVELSALMLALNREHREVQMGPWSCLMSQLCRYFTMSQGELHQAWILGLNASPEGESSSKTVLDLYTGIKTHRPQQWSVNVTNLSSSEAPEDLRCWFMWSFYLSTGSKELSVLSEANERRRNLFYPSWISFCSSEQSLLFWVGFFFECVLFCFLVCKLLYFCFLLWMMKCVLQERSAPSILVLFMYAYLLDGSSRNKPVEAAALQNYRCDSCIWQYMMDICGLSKELAVSFSHAQVKEWPLYQSSTSESFWHQQVMEVLPQRC